MRTNKDYTVYYDDFIGEITIPKGTKLTHQTALGIDENYHFVDDWSWYKPELKGFARKMHILDLEYRGFNVPKEYVQY